MTLNPGVIGSAAWPCLPCAGHLCVPCLLLCHQGWQGSDLQQAGTAGWIWGRRARDGTPSTTSTHVLGCTLPRTFRAADCRRSKWASRRQYCGAWGGHSEPVGAVAKAACCPSRSVGGCSAALLRRWGCWGCSGPAGDYDDSDRESGCAPGAAVKGLKMLRSEGSAGGIPICAQSAVG